MPRTHCPACDAQISTEVESCPQCGHPMRVPVGSTCYACAAPATTVCPRCGAFSCPQHLDSVIHSRNAPTDSGHLVTVGQSREFLCQPCHDAAIENRGKEFAEAMRFVAVLSVALIVITGILVAIYGWPRWP